MSTPKPSFLFPSIRKALPHIVQLLATAHAEGVPVIHGNDNDAEWRCHHGEIIETAQAGPRGELVREPTPTVTLPKPHCS